MHIFSISTIATFLAFTSVAVATPPSYGHGTGKPQPKPHHAPLGLNTAMRSKGREFFGAALTLREPKDVKERAIVDNWADFGSITPENAMKWESTEPNRGNFTLAGADAIRDYAKKYKKEVHCHTLVWHSQLPAWVSEGGFDNKTLIRVMTDHIKKVAGRYKGTCTRWDVVNEALNENGTYRETVWYNTIGEAYLPIAFRIAHQVDPHAKLYYNDYNLEIKEEKYKAAAKIVKLIKSYGVKIDGVGFQGHLVSEPTTNQQTIAPSVKDFVKALRTVSNEGVDVAYTEVDLRLMTPTTPKSLKTQVAAYERLTQSCMNVKRCVGLTVWGITDKYSWIPDVFPGQGDALVWDKNYKKKPIYAAILKVIKSAKKAKY